MAYEKRLCVLKQLKKGFTADGAPMTGAIVAERLGETLTLTPRIAGLTALREGRYVLAVQAGGECAFFELKGNCPLTLSPSPSVKEGFAALLCFVRGEAEPIAFGACGSASGDYHDLLKALQRRTQPIPVPMPPNQVPGAPSPQVPLAPAIPVPEEPEEPEEEPEEEEGGEDAPFRDAAAAGYDDEAIAAEDYFVDEGAEDAGAEIPHTQKADAEGDRICADEGSAPPFRLVRGGLTYFRTVEKKLKEAFEKFPHDEKLKGVFPHSEWVRAEGALLGIIYAEGVPKYLCVAMEAPPQEVMEYAVFVPVSVFHEEEGIYVVFQDADTGEYVTVSLS